VVLPNLIIAGAARSGTTYVYDLMDGHPDVFMARPKAPEPKFFRVDEEYEKGLTYYSDRYFSSAAGFSVVGEKSTSYIESPVAAERIRRCLPGVKLIFLLRNPVERAFSNYLWSRTNGWETLSFDEAIEREPEREADYPPELRYTRPFSYISRGYYADQLKAYMGLFPAEQIKVAIFEDLVSEPRETSRSLFAFTGVAPVEPRFDVAQSVNAARTTADRMSEAAYETLSAVYEKANRELAAMIGRDLDCWNKTAGVA